MKTWHKLSIVAVIGASAIAAQFTNQDTPTPEATRPVHERLFLATVHEKFPLAPDDEAVAVGHKVCRTLDSGATFDDLNMAVISQTSSASTVAFSGYVAGAAIGALCPEYSYQIPR